MPDHTETQFKEELKRRAEEVKRRTFEDESRKIGAEADERAKLSTQVRLADDSQAYARRLREAQEERRQKEAALKTQEEEVLAKLRKEAAKKTEARTREEEERKRREDEEKKRLEDAEKLRREEALRIAAEQEQTRREGEYARTLDIEKRRSEEERIRRDSERQRKEEEVRDHAREREERIRSLIAKAEVFYTEGDYEHASVEVAKALVNDPANPGALELERRIKETQGRKAEGPEGAGKRAKKARRFRVESPPITGRKKRYASALMISAVFALLVVSILVILELRKSTSTQTFTIAVLPWSSPSGVLEENIIGSSLAEVTAAGLRNYSSLVVMDFASAYRLAHHTSEPDQAAFHLGFRYAVMGTVNRSATGFSIAVKLTDSLRNAVWSRRFETPAESLAIVSAEIARQLAADLGSGLLEKPAGFAELRGPSDAVAYVLYLRGLEMLHRSTQEGTQNALVLLQEAIRQDGKFPEALAATGSVLAMRAERGWDASDSGLSRAKQFAIRAIMLEPSGSEGYLALGHVLLQQREYRTALAEIDTALRYSPKSGTILLSRAKALLQLGEYKEAIATLGRAYDLDPRDPDLLQTFGVAHQLGGTIRQGTIYHLTAVQCVDDSAAYLLGPFADAVVLDPDLSNSQSDRVAAAFRARLRAQPADYATMYRFARLLQVTGKALDAGNLLGKAETLLRSEIQRSPKDASAMMYLALTLTRQGKFPEGADLGLKAAALGKGIPEVKYKLAQLYSLQMYSQKEKKIDDKAKENALQALREAVALSYRLDELASADFYNLFEQPEFRTAIERAM